MTDDSLLLYADGALSRFDAHAAALQALVEKVQVFQHAVGYVDVDLSSRQPNSDSSSYKLAALYERYIEYAELLAGQGKERLALKYVAMTPADFEGAGAAGGSLVAVARERVLKAGGGKKAPVQQQQQSRLQQQQQLPYGQSAYGQPAYAQPQQQQQSAYGQPSYGGGGYNNPYAASNSVVGGGAASNPLNSSTRSAYNPYAAPPPVVAATAPPPNPYAAAPPPPPAGAAIPPRSITSPVRNNPYASTQAMVNPLDDPYAPPPGQQHQPSVPPAPLGGAGGNPYAPSVVPPILTATSASGAPMSDPYAPSHHNPAVGLPQPPAIREASPDFRQPASAFNAPPPPRAKPEVAWNDAPILPSRKTPAPAAPKPAVQAIASPFPNSSPVGSPMPPQMGQQFGPGGMNVPPPPPRFVSLLYFLSSKV